MVGILQMMKLRALRDTEGAGREIAEEERTTESTIAAAQAFHLQGRLSEAEFLYRNALYREPDALAAIQGLGAIEYQRGRVAEATSLFLRCVALRPDAAELHANLGEVLRIERRHDEALDHLNTALSLDSSQADAWNSLGLVAYDQGRYERAEAAHREAVRLRPGHAAPHVNLGIALQAMERLSEATESLREALRIEPDSPLALTNLGLVLCDTHDLDSLDEAESLCRRAVAGAPHLYQTHNNLGNVLRLMGRLDEAMSCYQQALRIAPHSAAPHQNMGQLLQQRGNYQEAARFLDKAASLEADWARHHTNRGGLAAEAGDFLEATRFYRFALQIDPGLAEAHHGLGRALLEQGQLDEAESWLRAAVRARPNLGESWVLLARLQAERGEFELSCESARNALKVRPTLPDAYWQLAHNFKGRMPDADVQAMRRLLGAKYVPDGARAMLQFGLAGVLDAQGDYSQAAALLKTANALQGAVRTALGRTYHPDENSRFVDRVISTFTPEAIARSRGWVDPDPRPVFVVGVPRSGTTLVEQVLASHPEVAGLGELPDLFRVFQRLPELVGHQGASPFEVLCVLGPHSAHAAARDYLSRLDSPASCGACRVVDKMPDNVRLLGLIAMLWPGARVIVCSRDLRDIALSCWQTWFATIPWANDWNHIARRLADHQRLLKHWRLTRPLEWLDVRYEDLVFNLEPNARRLINFLGLDWNPSCLQFHQTRRVVRTASLVQVRQPVYAHAVGRWRRYETMIAPLLEALERHDVRPDDLD
jgi:tetratricopeptide (TPR) repeat protein